MRIAQVAPLWLEVPPQTYGGTERIVYYLTEELIKRGHDVTLFATADSKTTAKLIPIWPRGLFAEANVWYAPAVFGLLYKELLERQHEFDLIHDHCEYFTTPFSKLLKPPIVTTLHSVFAEETTILYKKFPNINYVSISENQRRSGPGVNIVKNIYHGLPIDDFPFGRKPDDYLIWISNIAPDKGLSDAIEIAKMSNENLIISGPIFPRNAEYFEHRIKPLIDGKQIKFVGVSNSSKKLKLLKKAKAFLFPIFKRQEPFGLVVIEAMACGVPVIAADSGSMSELIQDKKTGFLVNSKEEAIHALRKISTISREECRKHVQENFSLRTMVDNYEQLYNQILQQPPVSKVANKGSRRVLSPKKS